MFTVRGHFHNMPRNMMTMMVMMMMTMMMMMMFLVVFTIRGHFHNLPQGLSSQSRPITIIKCLSIVNEKQTCPFFALFHCIALLGYHFLSLYSNGILLYSIAFHCIYYYWLVIYNFTCVNLTLIENHIYFKWYFLQALTFQHQPLHCCCFTLPGNLNLLLIGHFWPTPCSAPNMDVLLLSSPWLFSYFKNCSDSTVHVASQYNMQ